MADEPYYRLNHAEFLPWFNNLIKKITDNKAALPITADKIVALEERRDSHAAKLDAQAEADAAAQAATREINDDRKLSNEDISFINTTFKADKTIPRELLLDMGFKVSDGKTSTPPNEPTNLTVVPNVAGYTDLKWDRNGNKPSTIYEIESQTGESAEWKYVDSINGTKYRHLNQRAGVQVVYRVRAKRAGQTSGFGSAAVAYYQG
jgi:hypothetical protein